MHRQRDVADDVFGDVGRNFRCFLGPADPDHPCRIEERKQLRELRFEVGALTDEDVRRVDRDDGLLEQLEM